MVKLALLLAALAAGENPVASFLDPWTQEVRALLRYEAETIADVALSAIATFGKASTGGPYEGIAEADKAKVEERFVPQCAKRMEDLAEKMEHGPVARRIGDKSPTLGHSMSTYIRVNCEYLPMDTAKCNTLASEMKRLADAGHPLNPFPENATETPKEEAKAEEAAALLSKRRAREEPAAEEAAAEEGKAEEGKAEEGASDPAPTGEIMKDGGVWCTAFFDAFFDGLVKASEDAASDEAEAEGFLLMHKFSTTVPVSQKKDAWAPMRSLLSHEVKMISDMVKARGVKEGYSKAADADEAKVKEKFGPSCADTLQAVADNMLESGAGARRTMKEQLGVSMSTHLQVQCTTTDFPLSEEECDVSANELYRLIDEGNPLKAPAAANGTNGTNATEPAAEEAPAEEAPAFVQERMTPFSAEEAAALVQEDPPAEEKAEEAPAEDAKNATDAAPKVHANGEEWCGDFFDRFFKAILAALEGGEEGEKEAAALLQRIRHPLIRRVQ